MDSKLKRTVIVLTVFLSLSVLAIVVAANYNTIKKNYSKTSSEKQYEDTVTVSASDVYSKQLGDDLDAWKEDDSFFDQEMSLSGRLMQEMNTLSVSALSVEKDLRIRVLDYTKAPKIGELFEINIQKTDGRAKTIKDADKDGILYVENLEPGEYTVSLLPVDGYIVPDAGISVNVKETVDYAYIEDISLFINKESDAKKTSDDIMEDSALDDAAKIQNKTIGDDKNVHYGVIVKDINGTIDWKEVAASGIEFAMVRLGYRGASSGLLYEDSNFNVNVKGALYAGLDVGVYFDSQAVSEYEAIEEASMCVSLLERVNITYPVMVRMDRAGGNGRADSLSSEERTAVALAFEKTISNCGYDTGVNASGAWLNTNFESRKLERNHIWLADYRKDQIQREYYYDFWQYTALGSVKGVDGDVSLAISYIE